MEQDDHRGHHCDMTVSEKRAVRSHLDCIHHTTSPRSEQHDMIANKSGPTTTTCTNKQSTHHLHYRDTTHPNCPRSMPLSPFHSQIHTHTYTPPRNLLPQRLPRRSRNLDRHTHLRPRITLP
jgi:hypothetical protein